MKNQVLSLNTQIKDQKGLFEKAMQELKVAIQNQQTEILRMTQIIEKDEEMKNVLNANQMIELNKVLKTQVNSMRRQLDQKDAEIDGLQNKMAAMEKKMVLVQKDV
jgi:hypothetical protein